MARQHRREPKKSVKTALELPPARLIMLLSHPSQRLLENQEPQQEVVEHVKCEK